MVYALARSPDGTMLASARCRHRGPPLGPAHRRRPAPPGRPRKQRSCPGLFARRPDAGDRQPLRQCPPLGPEDRRAAANHSSRAGRNRFAGFCPGQSNAGDRGPQPVWFASGTRPPARRFDRPMAMRPPSPRWRLPRTAKPYSPDRATAAFTCGTWPPRRIRASLEGPPRPTFLADFAPDGGTLVTMNEGRQIFLWDPAKGTLRQTFQRDAIGLAFSAEGQARVWAADSPWAMDQGRRVVPRLQHFDGSFQLLDLATGKPLHSFQMDQKALRLPMRFPAAPVPLAQLPGHLDRVSCRRRLPPRDHGCFRQPGQDHRPLGPAARPIHRQADRPRWLDHCAGLLRR